MDVSSCVKIYLCSNPQDSVVERRALRDCVFPRLRVHCRELGLDLRVIDPYESRSPSRWPSQQTRQSLIQECTETSAGAFLLALVGQQYGAASLPSQLDAPLYHLLLQGCQEAGIRTQPLERAYVRDENTLPPSYCLRRPPTHTHQAEEEVERMLGEEEEELMKVFQMSVSLCVQQGLVTSERALSFYRSALDADLRFALEKQPTHDIITRCMVYVHKITNEKGQGEGAGFEISNEKSQNEGVGLEQANPDSQLTLDQTTGMKPSDEQLMSQLRDNFLPGLVTSCQLLVYTTTTECDRRHGYTPARRRGYVESLCQQLYSDLLDMIDSAVSMETTQPVRQLSHLDDALVREQAEQEELCCILSDLYDITRPEEEQIRAYVEQSDRACPLVVTGRPCTGKTVLLAHCARQVKLWLADRDPVVVTYFSSYSTSPSPKQLLSRLCHQVAHHYRPLSDVITAPDADPNHTPTTTNHPSHHKPVVSHPDPNLSVCQLKHQLSLLLSLLSSVNRPLVLILDQIRSLQVLPSPLPPNVKVLLSASSSSIRLQYPESTSPACVESVVCVALGPADRRQSVRMLASLLKDSGRSVTSGQQVLVNQALTSCPLGLYARLLHRHASLWTSDSEVTESSLPDSVHSSVCLLLDVLQQRHGSSLLRLSLSYLFLSRTGLTEAELTDLLSSDDEVLAGYIMNSEDPPSRRRVSEVEVETLLLDLRGFVRKRTVAGKKLLVWVSRHLSLVVEKRFLGSEQVRQEIHSALADYFNGRWAYGRAKPLTVTQDPGPDETTAASVPVKLYIDRQPADQPFVFKPAEPSHSSSTELGLVNLRKITELPYHLRESGRWEELGRLLVMSLRFHQAMLRAGLLDELVALLEGEQGSAHLLLPRERALLVSILKSSACLLRSSPLELSTVMEARLLPYLGVYPELEAYGRELQQERSRASRVGVVLCPAPYTVPCLHRALPQYQSGERTVAEAAGTGCGTLGTVETVCGTVGTETGTVGTACGTVLGVRRDGSVWVWRGGCSEVEDLSLDSLRFVCVMSSGDFVLLHTTCNKLLLWDVTGPQTFQPIKHPLKAEAEPEGDQATPNVLEGFVACQNRVCMWWRAGSFVSVCDVPDREPLTHYQCDSTVTCLTCSSDGSYMYCGQEDGSVSLFDLKAGILISTCSNPQQTAVKSVILCGDQEDVACLDIRGNISLWYMASKTQPPALRKERLNQSSGTEAVISTDYSEVMNSLLVCEAHQITLWDTWDWELWDEFLAPQGKAFTIALLAPEGHLFLAALEACSLVLVWRVSTGQCVLSLDSGADTQPLTLLKLDSCLISVSGNGCLTVWDSELILAAGVAPKMRSGVRKVLSEPMGEHFYVTDGSETVWGWGLDTESPEAHYLHDGPVEKLCLSPDGSHLVTLSGGDIYVWRERGHNILRIHGSEATDILVTPSGSFGVSLSERGPSRVWKLETGGVVCHIHLYLADAQVSSESTFLIGRHRGDLLAASLWSGSVSKRFSCSECTERVVAFQTLPEHPDFVVVMSASGCLYTWKLAEETVCRQFQLPYTLPCPPNDFHMSPNGSHALLSTDDDIITLLDLSQARLCSFRTEGRVFKARLEKTGQYIVYISHPLSQGNGCVCHLHAKPVLSVVRLSDGGSVGRLCLCKSPSTLSVCEQQLVFVGFDDGSVGVYSISDVMTNGGGAVRGRVDLIGQEKLCSCDREPMRCLPLATPSVTWPNMM